MEVIRDLDWCPEFPRGTTVTFGVLDGVHRGHRVVLLETVRTAVVEGCPSVVVTFDPRSYLDAAALLLLTDFEQKLELLEASEIDYVIELPADRIPDVPADAFDADEDPRVQWIVDEVLVNTLHARAVVVGENYHFGTQRWRTIEQVMRRSSDAGFRVVQIPVKSGRSATGDVVSAQSIRDLLAAGDVEAAAERLGRPHEVRAIVSVGRPARPDDRVPDHQPPAPRRRAHTGRGCVRRALRPTERRALSGGDQHRTTADGPRRSHPLDRGPPARLPRRPVR